MDIVLAGKSYRCQRVFCIGRNYVEHIEELGNEKPAAPVIFSKFASALVPADTQEIPFPRCGEAPHYETELVVLIGKAGVPENTDDAAGFIAGLAVGFDLTLRETQERLKKKSLPWEICKSFDGSAPIGDFVPFSGTAETLRHLSFSGAINGRLRQQADTCKMIFPIPELILAVARYWHLQPGDLLYTGTPSGVGNLAPGDTLTCTDHTGQTFSWRLGMPQGR